MKEGCRLEHSQLDDARDLQRLAALQGVIAVRMLQVRDLAAPDRPEANNPAVLQRTVPALWIKVVSHLGGVAADALTPRQFILTIARRGGYLGRRHNGRPGWKVIWRGWYDVERMVEGLELMLPP